MSFRIDREEVKKSLENIVKEKLFDGTLLKKYLETKFFKVNIHIEEFDLGEVSKFELSIKSIEEPTKELIERSPPAPNVDSIDLNFVITFYLNVSLSKAKIKVAVSGEVNFPLPELARTNKTTILISELNFEDTIRASIINGYFMIWMEPGSLRIEPKFSVEFEEYEHLDKNPLEAYILGMMRRKLSEGNEIKMLYNVPFGDLLWKIKSS